MALDDVKYVTVEEIAAAARVAKMSVYRAIHAGDLPAVRLGPKVFRVTEHDARVWLGVCEQ